MSLKSVGAHLGLYRLIILLLLPPYIFHHGLWLIHVRVCMNVSLIVIHQARLFMFCIFARLCTLLLLLAKKKTWTTTNRTQRILWDSFLSIHVHNRTESINQTLCNTRVTCTCFSFIIIVVWMKRTHVRLINETRKIFVRIKICDYLKASSIGSFKFNFPSAIYDSCLLGYCDFLLFSLLLLLYQINKRR